LEKNIEKIHKFQHKANPDENERISDALFTPSPSHPYMMKIFIDVAYLGDMIEKNLTLSIFHLWVIMLDYVK
jgi:hypothetical protein